MAERPCDRSPTRRPSDLRPTGQTPKQDRGRYCAATPSSPAQSIVRRRPPRIDRCHPAVVPVDARIFARSHSRSARRAILPVAVIGRLSTNAMARGYSCAASRVRTCSLQRADECIGRRHGNGVQHDERLDELGAHGIGHPDGRGHTTAGCRTSASSISAGPIR